MILTFDNVGWFNDIIREFFGAIDYLIYSLIAWILEGIFNLANLMANPTLVQVIYKRVYVILAIFMVFKLTISFINYLINPDMFTDKEKGVGKLISRTIVMLILLVALPILFFNPISSFTSNPNYSSDSRTILNVAQDGIIRTLPKIILGVASANNSSTVGMDAQKNGNYMAVKMLESFYYPSMCNTESPAYTAGTECSTTDLELTSIRDFSHSLTYEAKTGGVYEYQYMWPLTTIAGILLVVILLGMALDVAIRVFKLMVLQMIAPVPVMSYIDPKSSKDGAFASWIKSFTSTFLDLFLKLGTVYLLLLLVSKMFTSDATNNLFSSGINNISGFMARNFVRVFLIIGLFKFAKEAPKFLKEALGIKDKGGGGGFMGKALAGMAGAAAGFAAGGVSGAISGFSMGAENAGSGKPTKAYSRIRDENAKKLGQPEGGLKGRIQQMALQRKVNRKTGVNKQTLDAAKDNWLDAQKIADQYKMEYEANPTSHSVSDVIDKINEAQTAQLNYEKAKKLGDSIGIGSSFYKQKTRHFAPYRAAKNAVGEAKYETSKGKGILGGIDQAKDSSSPIHIFGRDIKPLKSVHQKSDKAVKQGGFDPNKRS